MKDLNDALLNTRPQNMLWVLSYYEKNILGFSLNSIASVYKEVRDTRRKAKDMLNQDPDNDDLKVIVVTCERITVIAKDLLGYK